MKGKLWEAQPGGQFAGAAEGNPGNAGPASAGNAEDMLVL